jgi:hypothetical protein
MAPFVKNLKTKLHGDIQTWTLWQQHLRSRWVSFLTGNFVLRYQAFSCLSSNYITCIKPRIRQLRKSPQQQQQRRSMSYK